VVTNGLTVICGPEHLILFPYIFSTIGPPKTWVAKFETDPDADALGAAVLEVLAKAGLLIKLIARI
tara:strand:+ start:277 stop:474 length:198 start_codon:yes stop_codon:yes gene_type:complete